MKRRYKKPPFQEVICEIGLDERTQWDLAIPGLLYERLKENFPQRESRRVKDVELEQGPQGSALTIKDSERAVFLSSDRRRLVQVGTRLVVVNQLPPYPGWEAFKIGVNTVYKVLDEVVEIKGIRALAVKYIDRIEVLEPSVKIEDYFFFRPHFEGIKEGEPLDSWRAFIVGVQTPFEQERDALRIQLSLGPPTEGKTVFLLETAYALLRQGALGPAEVHGWLDVAHEQIIKAFEKAITDKLRTIFEPE